MDVGATIVLFGETASHLKHMPMQKNSRATCGSGTTGWRLDLGWYKPAAAQDFEVFFSLYSRVYLLISFFFFYPEGTCPTLHVRKARHRWSWVFGKPSIRTLETWTLWPVPLRKLAKSSRPHPPRTAASEKSRTQRSPHLGRAGSRQINSWQTFTAWTVAVWCAS